MQKNRLYGALDFEYVLLEQYKSLALTENELAVILMIAHLQKQGNRMITADALALKMSLRPSEIEKILSALLKRNLIDYVPEKKGMKTSLEPIQERVYTDFAKRLEREEETIANAEKAQEISEIAGFIEQKLGRSLSPLEQTTLQEWFVLGYSKEDIKDAFLDCLSAGNKNFKAVERALKQLRKRRDIEKEGHSAVSEAYDADIDETFALAKKLFGDR